MTTPDLETLEHALHALRWGSSEPLTLKLGSAPEVVLHPVDARPIRQAAQRVLKTLLREQQRRAVPGSRVSRVRAPRTVTA